MSSGQSVTVNDLTPLFGLLLRKPMPKDFGWFLSIPQVAHYTQFATSDVHRWMHEGQLGHDGIQVFLFTLELMPGFHMVPRMAVYAFGEGRQFQQAELDLPIAEQWAMHQSGTCYERCATPDDWARHRKRQRQAFASDSARVMHVAP